ncbi:MAG TPA: FABP family protein [Acidimicrobiales bacterium]|nr:FABP family protein [Acidimicrobiales bacterium]
MSAPDPLDAVAAFAGTWEGRGEGSYPTIDDFAYTERIELVAVPGKAMLGYRSTTRAGDDGRALHAESGFLRVVGPAAVELVVAQGAGLVEIAEGSVADGVIELLSTVVRGTSTAKDVAATVRRYQVAGDELSYELWMAAVGQPLRPHLRAQLARA